MSYDYSRVSQALKDGADPSFLCSTCPWDRPCLLPPAMTSQDVEEQTNRMMRKAEADARARAEKEGREYSPGDTLVPTIITTLAFAGQDTKLTGCPVFILRLRSSDGRDLLDDLRRSMQGAS